MLLMAIAAWLYAIAVTLKRVRCEILDRERHAAWVSELVDEAK
jgi:heme exporter protein C